MVKIPTAIIGATGIVGQRFVHMLDHHPWFQVTSMTGSERNIGLSYAEACRWTLSEPMPEWASGMVLGRSDPDETKTPLIFSSLPTQQAVEIEANFAQAGAIVCTNASAFRAEPDVPILLPEVNPDHLELIHIQRRLRGWQGGIITNANCTSTGMTVVLKALSDHFGVKRVFAVSLQALSGAGLPGVASLEIADNVLPWIAGEEEKVELEPRKILGRLNGAGIQPAEIVIAAHTNRVAVTDGHLVCLSVELDRKASIEQVSRIIAGYEPPEISKGLPHSPDPVIKVMEEADRPQPRRDRMVGGGMTTVVGRLRPDPIFDLRLVVLSHNTIRGAAGGSILNAELAVKAGLLG
jgi:aspartate-semialdehyde dehydrogenase